MDISEHALGLLRAAKLKMREDKDIREIIDAKNQVIARYSPSFQFDMIGNLEEEVLRSFLYFENNKHWSGLNRQVNRVCADISKTRYALKELVDENKPIAERMQKAVDIKGMGRGIITAILHVAYPDSYGVWNTTSHEGLVKLGLFPQFLRGSSFGSQYAAVNDILKCLATALEIDLWTLDTVWWYLKLDDSNENSSFVETNVAIIELNKPSAVMKHFALEKHLQNYMFNNWNTLDLSKQWKIYETEGEPDLGYEYTTPVGRIDLLAKHESEPRWLVIELKRDKSSDQVVGQILRYIGWVQAHLAKDSDKVEGLIVATGADSKLQYAISAIPSVSYKSYEVDFKLTEGPSFDEFAKPQKF